MQKIISLFMRNYDTDYLVRNEVVPGAEWVIAGEGIATRKWDGMSVLVRSNKLFKRYELNQGRVAPPGFEPAQEPDAITLEQPGWIPADDDRRFIIGYRNTTGVIDGTYELCGPGVNKNEEGFTELFMLRHGGVVFHDAPRTFDKLKDWFSDHDIDGLVWHHNDGRMVKIKKRDFGMRRKVGGQ